jgi:hypothetical protein
MILNYGVTKLKTADLDFFSSNINDLIAVPADSDIAFQKNLILWLALISCISILVNSLPSIAPENYLAVRGYSFEWVRI